MTDNLDIIIRCAQLRDRPGRLVDIGIAAGRIWVIEEHLTLPAETEIDAHGNLVTESFVNPHLHLCKAYTLQMMDEKALKDYHGEAMGKAMERKGTVVTHTAEGDIHDIGQVIVNALLNANGFNVVNLGADVPVDKVVAACKEHKPIMVTGTALMTTTMTAFPKIGHQLKAAGLNIPFICGGGAVCEEYVTGYDLGVWGKEASQSTGMAEDALAGESWESMRDKWNG